MSKRTARTAKAGKVDTRQKKVANSNKKSVAPEPASVTIDAETTDNAPLGIEDAPSVPEPAPTVPAIGTETQEKRIMETRTLTFTKLSKSGVYAIYAGLRPKIRIAVTAFPNSQPVPSFTVEGEFAGPRERKPAMTAEQRKAWRAAQPKLTLEQQIAKDEARLARKRAKLAASQAATENTPVGTF